MELTLLTIPVIAFSLNEILKQIGMQSKYSGLVNIGIGLIGGYIIQPNLSGIVAGFLAGLSAGGAYSAVKTINKQ